MPKVVAKKEAESTPEVHQAESSVLLEVPISEIYPHGFPVHIELNLSGELSMVLRRIARAYDRQQATLKDGTRVVYPTTALRKLLEDLAEQTR